MFMSVLDIDTAIPELSRDLQINLNMKILKLTLQNGKTREIPSFLGKLGQNENFEINAIKWQDPSYPGKLGQSWFSRIKQKNAEPRAGE